MRAVIAALLLGALACSGGEYELVVRFEPASTAAEAQRIEVAVVDGPCAALGSLVEPPASPIRTIELSRGALAPLGELPPASYGLVGRAFSADCAIVAAGCADVTLAAGGSGTLELVLVPMSGGGCTADEACVDGECVVETDGGPMVDGGPMPMVDGGPMPMEDGGPITRRDGGRPTDSGMVVMSDGGPPDGGGTRSCVDIFGMAPMYELCSDTPTECTFFTRAFMNCDVICMRFGETCIHAYNEVVDLTCDIMGEIPCSMNHNDVICTCSR